MVFHWCHGPVVRVARIVYIQSTNAALRLRVDLPPSTLPIRDRANLLALPVSAFALSPVPSLAACAPLCTSAAEGGRTGRISMFGNSHAQVSLFHWFNASIQYAWLLPCRSCLAIACLGKQTIVGSTNACHRHPGQHTRSQLVANKFPANGGEANSIRIATEICKRFSFQSWSKQGHSQSHWKCE